MSQPSRPRARGPEQRRRRPIRLDTVSRLEDRCLLAPFVSTTTTTTTFVPAPGTPPPNTVTGTVEFDPADHPSSPAPLVSVAQLSASSAFGGDIVRIEAGPGGDFGKGLYAISRGGGDNLPTGAINRPGVIYRVDPVTGQSSVFFDLNTLANQLEPGANANNGLDPTTGYLNWYDITFDSEGYFDGRPSMFVSTVSSTDSNKNAIFRIGPDGSFLGAFAVFSEGQSSLNLTRSPTSILVPPPEQQQFLRGLFSGTGSSAATTGVFNALFFDANEYRPGQSLSSTTLPNGVAVSRELFLGPQSGLTAANSDYVAPIFSSFANFGTPGGGGIPAQPGLSGVQSLGGGLIINNGVQPDLNEPDIDLYPAINTTFRRLEDIAFDQYGYFSYGFPSTVTDGAVTFDTTAPLYAGSLFVADLASGESIAITPAGGTNPPVQLIPIQGPASVTVVVNPTTNEVTNTVSQGNVGGRILRITPDGIVTPFAEGFNTSGAQDFNSFLNSSLSITFSADGTTLYAADDDGIWQFKTVASLAGSSSGSIIGLNDLRTLGVPYEGQDSAVAIVDTGVDARTPQFRGRVAEGTNVLFNGPGNDDFSPGGLTDPGQNVINAGVQGGVGSIVDGGGTGGGGQAPTGNINGHGTPLAGVVAQFVPQATLQPVNIFTPNVTAAGGQGGGLAGVFGAQAITTNDAFFQGLGFLAGNPYASDPIRPNKQDRVVAAAMGFGTVETFDTEGTAFRTNKQVVIAFKNQMKKLRSLGIAPVAPAGQFGQPVGAGFTPGPGQGSGVVNDVTGIGGDVNGMALPAILSEVLSVTGTYSLPFAANATTPPTDPSQGVVPRPVAPILVRQFIANSAGGVAPPPPTTGNVNTITNLTTGDAISFADKILASSNRNATTDYAAPEFDVPTFRRVFTGDGFAHNVFTEAGTSMSAGIVTGSIALVGSAIDYWTDLNQAGSTVDAYLTQPVDARSLNYGVHAFQDLSAYANPDGINAILQWTAVPVTDQDLGGDISAAPQLIGSTHFREYSRVDVGNAVAAIEGTMALNYLLERNTFDIIDGNHNGLVTAQEIQTFVDQSSTVGLAEAGSMARLLGGTGRAAGNGFTIFGERPDQPDVLARRFNFFDYAADGDLNGAISIDQLKVLARNLLPTPDAFVVVDRQRASNNGYLVEAGAQRNWKDLQKLLPQYAWVPKSMVDRYRNLSPSFFHVNRGLNPLFQSPVYTLFSPGGRPEGDATQGTGNRGRNRAGANRAGDQAQAPSNTGTSGTAQQQGSTLPAQGEPISSSQNQGQAQGNQASDIVKAIQGLANQGATSVNQGGTTLGEAKPTGTMATDQATPTTDQATPTADQATPGLEATSAPAPASSTPPPAEATSAQSQTQQERLAQRQQARAAQLAAKAAARPARTTPGGPRALAAQQQTPAGPNGQGTRQQHQAQGFHGPNSDDDRSLLDTLIDPLNLWKK